MINACFNKYLYSDKFCANVIVKLVVIHIFTCFIFCDI